MGDLRVAFSSCYLRRPFAYLWSGYKEWPLKQAFRKCTRRRVCCDQRLARFDAVGLCAIIWHRTSETARSLSRSTIRTFGARFLRISRSRIIARVGAEHVAERRDCGNVLSAIDHRIAGEACGGSCAFSHWTRPFDRLLLAKVDGGADVQSEPRRVQYDCGTLKVRHIWGFFVAEPIGKRTPIEEVS